jgi:hypothetical protein
MIKESSLSKKERQRLEMYKINTGNFDWYEVGKWTEVIKTGLVRQSSGLKIGEDEIILSATFAAHFEGGKDTVGIIYKKKYYSIRTNGEMFISGYRNYLTHVDDDVISFGVLRDAS